MESMNHVFANRSDDEEIFPITVNEIAEAQRKDKDILDLCNEEKFKHSSSKTQKSCAKMEHLLSLSLYRHK